MSFINDFMEFSSHSECPKNFRYWASLSALAIAASRRYYIQAGIEQIRPGLYICFIAEQGVKKSYAKDLARDLISEAFPDYPIAAAMQSREDIVSRMAMPEGRRDYIDHEGTKINYTPLALYINELKNFLSFNPQGMIEFLTDIYDRRSFDASTIKRGLERFPFPHLNILACETPDWMVDKLKLKVISGGFSRRFIFVYEFDNPSRFYSLPGLPGNHTELWLRMKQHLVKVASTAKQYHFNVEGLGFYDLWYIKTRKESLIAPDQFTRGYLRIKGHQLIRICILLDLAEEEPEYLITPKLLEKGLAFFELIEPNLPKLYSSAGRNELAVSQQKLLDYMESQGGVLAEKKLLQATETEMTMAEQQSVIRYLESTDRLIRKSIPWPPATPTTPVGPSRVMIFLPSKYRELVETGAWKEVEKKVKKDV